MAARKPVADAAPLPTREQWRDWVKQQTEANPEFIPPNQLCMEDIHEWQIMVERSRAAQASEMLLRKKVFGWFFPLPVEGTNNAKLPDGTIIKGTHKITRNVDEVRLAVVKSMTVGDARAQLEQMKVAHQHVPDDTPLSALLQLNFDKLVKWKPDLATAEYRTLTAEQAMFFEQALEIKPGSPTLEVIPPKLEA